MIEKYMADNSDKTFDPDKDIEAKRDRTSQFLEGVFNRNDQVRQKRQDEINRIIAETPDKEPFDIDTLKQHYNLADLRIDNKDKQELQGVIDEYREMYYLGNQNIKNIADFAERLKEQDRNEAN